MMTGTNHNTQHNSQHDDLRIDVLVPAHVRGEVLCLTTPLSFWGGINPVTAEVSDPRHPQFGQVISDRVLVLSTRGSSSSSAILLELIYAGIAPKAIVLTHVDAILALGAVAARELGFAPPAILHIKGAHPLLVSGEKIEITVAGAIRRIF